MVVTHLHAKFLSTDIVYIAEPIHFNANRFPQKINAESQPDLIIAGAELGGIARRAIITTC